MHLNLFGWEKKTFRHGTSVGCVRSFVGTVVRQTKPRNIVRASYWGNPKYVFTYALKTLYPNRVVLRVAESFLRRRSECVNVASLFRQKPNGVCGVRFPIGRPGKSKNKNIYFTPGQVFGLSFEINSIRTKNVWFISDSSPYD